MPDQPMSFFPDPNGLFAVLRTIHPIQGPLMNSFFTRKQSPARCFFKRTAPGQLVSTLFFVFLLFAASCTPAPKQGPVLTGTVNLAPNVPLWMMHGDLSIVVFMKGSTSPAYLPVAISVYPHPVFPVTFKITQQNVRLSGISLSGNVKVGARLRLRPDGEDSAPIQFTSGPPVSGIVGGTPVTLTISQEKPS